MNTQRYPYCLLSDVKTELHLGDNDEYDNKLSVCIENATAWVDSYCKRSWQPLDRTVDGLFVMPEWKSSSVYYLLPFNVINITKVVVDGESIPTSSAIYYPHTRTVQLVSKYNNCIGAHAKVQLFGMFGSVKPPQQDLVPIGLPFAVQRATTLIACSMSGEYRTERVTQDGERLSSLITSIPKEAYELLKQYTFMARQNI